MDIPKSGKERSRKIIIARERLNLQSRCEAFWKDNLILHKIGIGNFNPLSLRVSKMKKSLFCIGFSSILKKQRPKSKKKLTILF